jgi:hypothetical protein
LPLVGDLQQGQQRRVGRERREEWTGVRTDEQRGLLAARLLRAGDWQAVAGVEAAVKDVAVRERIDRERNEHTRPAMTDRR